jgi:leucyl-tRNA synthetase
VRAGQRQAARPHRGATDASEPAILAAAKADDKVQTFLAGKAIKKAIYVKGRLVSLVI